MLEIKNPNYNIKIRLNEKSAWFESGKFGDVSFLKNEIFTAELKNVFTKDKITVSSLSNFKEIKVNEIESQLILTFIEPNLIEGLIFIVKGEFDEKGVSWFIEAQNQSIRYAVVSLSYPTPKMTAEKYDVFLPYASGRVLKDAQNIKYSCNDRLYSMDHTMAYYAIYGLTSGIYLGIEDKDGAMKTFDIKTENSVVSLMVSCDAVNVNEAKNSFKAFGKARWEYFEGDWYDATHIYANFVYNNATWLPKKDEKGRIGTPNRFKNIGYWVSDYIPNNEYHRDNFPRSFKSKDIGYGENYWYQAVIDLQKELNVPVAYHVYNWHKIPFNIEYPHFLPEREGFKQGLDILKENGIMVCPYINGLSWEMNDHEGGHDFTFESLGRKGAVINDDGKIRYANYPQTTISGINSRLAIMCPSFTKWHDIIEEVTRGMEALGVDGVYFDQIAAYPPPTCHNPSHNHLPGGGDFWVKQYNAMMKKIRNKKPNDAFYFSEGNGEVYAKHFDGLLTWNWIYSDEVPAFPLIYSGYVEMVGRYLVGPVRENDVYYKYSLAKSFLFGQQLGWGMADVIANPVQLGFLKKIAKLRYDCSEFFHTAKLMRPPKVTCDKSPEVIPPLLWSSSDLVMEKVLAGAWKDKNCLRIFIFNIDNEKSSFTLEFNAKEYGLNSCDCPKNFDIIGETCLVKDEIDSNDYIVYEVKEI